ncbi:MAG: stage III sporulation protein AB [Eubacteriales bacterium]
MFKIVASFLVLSGAIGYAYRLYFDHLERIEELKKMEYYMGIMENEIQYSKADVCEICRVMILRTEGIYQEFFRKLYEEMKYNGGSSFVDLWKQHSELIREIKTLRERDIILFQEYPPPVAFLDGGMQEKDSVRKREALRQYREQEEEQLQKNQKLYLTMGVMSGLFFVVLFF